MPNNSGQNWLREINVSWLNLSEPASRDDIIQVENGLRIFLPSDYVEFMLTSNGVRRIFTNGSGILIWPIMTPWKSSWGREKTMEYYNTRGGPFQEAIVIIGVDDADEPIGFKNDDVVERKTSCAVYMYSHEEGELEECADSFRSLIERIAAMGDDEKLSPMFHRHPTRDWWKNLWSRLRGKY